MSDPCSKETNDKVMERIRKEFVATPTVEELEAELAESERQTRAQLFRIQLRDRQIEELKAELDAEYRSRVLVMDELELEIERLEAENDTWETLASSYLDRITRLEAKVKDAFYSGFSYGETNQIDEDSAWKAYTGGE